MSLWADLRNAIRQAILLEDRVDRRVELDLEGYLLRQFVQFKIGGFRQQPAVDQEVFEPQMLAVQVQVGSEGCGDLSQVGKVQRPLCHLQSKPGLSLPGGPRRQGYVVEAGFVVRVLDLKGAFADIDPRHCRRQINLFQHLVGSTLVGLSGQIQHQSRPVDVDGGPAYASRKASSTAR